MSETEALFGVLRQSADPGCAAAIESAVAEAPDRELCRINPVAFAVKNNLNEELTIAAFLHAARLGLFELSWNVLCPDCGGVLDAGTTLKTVRHDEYGCALCAADYKPTLDEMVEVTFTVAPRVRGIAGHHPDTLPEAEYYRQIFWSSGMDLPENLEAKLAEFTIDSIELPPGAKGVLSVQLPEGFVIVFDPVTHGRQILAVEGEPTRERQALSIVFNKVKALLGTAELRPGPLRLSLENRMDRRVLPTLWISGDALHNLLGRRRPFLTAKRLLTNQTFRDLYHTDTIDPDQRLKITSLTFLFTDLKGSTALYERVGDIAAYDLVRQHFGVLYDIVASETGAVVKTIGDAVMATFATPDRALAAALRMREAMTRINDDRGNEDLLLKIGIHEGPCLAVRLNNSQDYFGQTVNIAARVQGLASSRAIIVTQPVMEDPKAAKILQGLSAHPSMHRAALRGIADETIVYEIP
ncbi:MAG TPA: adenylate/guanylate cyclase domain-containing protein [Xanthobacteraceae bacterium]|nr:adenylate/guanylate cyclase domain-containing protein [Xanthobacteraceae bacterium]